MNELTVFNYDSNDIRTVQKDGEVWFVGKDVSDVLGYDQTSNMVKRLDDDDFISSNLDGMNMKSILINESGLYAAVLGSKLPTAKQFKKWVTSEVLPSIRKHGGYLTADKIEEVLSDPDTIIKMATNLKAEREKRAQLESKLEEQEPKVVFADAVAASKTSILVGELAKVLKQNGVDIGQNRLFDWLRNNGYLISRNGTDYNMPTQKAMELKLFEIKETSIAKPDGSIHISKTTKVTGKGQQYFINKFLGDAA